MQWILALGISLLLAGGADHPMIEEAPTEDAPVGFIQPGLVVLDLQISDAGEVSKETVMFGGPPFLERSRGSAREWRFRPPANDGAHVDATFVYKPKLKVPDSDSVFDVAVPPADLKSAFPTRVVVPGFPRDSVSGGTVVMQAVLDAGGIARSVRVVSGPPSLLDNAVSALRAWQFHVPDALAPASRSAVVAMYFQAPEFAVAPENVSSKLVVAATLDAGIGEGVPSAGTSGNLAAGDPLGLSFEYGDSRWLLPYSTITSIEYAGSRDDRRVLTISYEGGTGLAAVAFQVPVSGLSTASILSARSGKPIEFAP
jgi:hypothetical protein